MNLELLCWSPSWWRSATVASPSIRGGPSTTGMLFLHHVSQLFHQVPQATPCCSHSCRRSWVQRCALAQSNYAGLSYGRNMCLLGCCGKRPLDTLKGIQDKSLQAPTMASLAKQGVVLEQNYVQPKCAPSRAALMTGDP